LAEGAEIGHCSGLATDFLSMRTLGLAITFATVLGVVIAFLRSRPKRLPLRGWAGLAMLAVAELLLFGRVWWVVAVYFTPIAWTAYLLVLDAMVEAAGGRSRMRTTPWEFASLALLSIPLWLIFEAYNLRLENWTYIGVPLNWLAAWIGYGWSFATIFPAILVTADLIETVAAFRRARPRRVSATGDRAMVAFGGTCLVLPLLLPKQVAAYLFVLVWVGFVFLLDPVNRWMRLPSLLGDLAEGQMGRIYSLFLSGWVCGWLWEFWNYWAAAKWQYIFPIAQGWKIFEMPAPGFLGFMPFALECFVIYTAATCGLKRLSHQDAPESMLVR
jgi:hypothetical protein